VAHGLHRQGSEIAQRAFSSDAMAVSIETSPNTRAKCPPAWNVSLISCEAEVMNPNRAANAKALARV
jgi:hypothetical protein